MAETDSIATARRVGSEFWAILPARFTAKARCCTSNEQRAIVLSEVASAV